MTVNRQGMEPAIVSHLKSSDLSDRSNACYGTSNTPTMLNRSNPAVHAAFQEHSLLLSLPKELREPIWRPVVTYDEPIYISKLTPEWPPQPSLARVCQLLRYECLPIYFSTNTFILIADDPHFEMSCAWVQRMRNAPGFNRISKIGISSSVYLSHYSSRVTYTFDLNTMKFLGPADMRIVQWDNVPLTRVLVEVEKMMEELRIENEEGPGLEKWDVLNRLLITIHHNPLNRHRTSGDDS